MIASTLFQRMMTALCLLAMLAVHGPAQAADSYLLEFNSGEDLAEMALSVGKSQIIASRSELDQVVIGNPNIADIKVLSSTQVLILGMRPGHTNLVIRNKRPSLVAVVDVVVGYDIGQIKRKIWEMLPDEEGVEIRASNDKVLVSGHVSSLMAMEQVMSVTRSFVPEESIVNMMQVGGGHQVMLEVRMAEISRTSLRDLGIETSAVDNASDWSQDISTGLTGGTTSFLTVGYSATDKYGFDTLDVTLKALEKRGLGRVLAEPNLTALSGQEASFLAGGEVAIPVSQSGSAVGAVTVEYKEFGIGLRFTPVVLDQDRINIRMNAEVSSLDSTNALQASGFNIPGLTTRRTGTTVEIGDGQSFAIAGLLEKNMNNVINEVPGLGRIPVLGALFRSTEFQRSETELVVMVTPRLVAPVRQTDIELPTDVVMPPTELDQYLFGFLENLPRPERDSQADVSSTGTQVPMRTDAATVTTIEGQYGHQIR